MVKITHVQPPSRIILRMQTLAMDYLNGATVPHHSHPEDQLLFASAGVMHVRCDQGDWVVPSGCALWMPAAVGHEIRMSGDVRMRTLLMPAQAQACQMIEVPALLRELILAASRLLNVPRMATSEALRALVASELKSARRLDAHIPMPPQAKLRALCERVLADPAQDLTLEQCGVLMNASARTVARLFQRELGMSFAEWRTRTRMILSQQRLTEGAPILHVALDHGYQSASAFAAVFKRVLGYTPSECSRRGLERL